MIMLTDVEYDAFNKCLYVWIGATPIQNPPPPPPPPPPPVFLTKDWFSHTTYFPPVHFGHLDLPSLGVKRSRDGKLHILAAPKRGSRSRYRRHGTEILLEFESAYAPHSLRVRSLRVS